MGLADLALSIGQGDLGDNKEVDIITFVESDWALGVRLYPVQRVILKAYYSIPLDNSKKSISVPQGQMPWLKKKSVRMTEAEYLEYLYSEGRCNKREITGSEDLRELVLAIGRRSGKTFLSSCIGAYEIYKLILKGCPQEYYGIGSTSEIGVVSVATGTEQAGLLYNEMSGHFHRCDFFEPYVANNTMSYAKFQTPADIERFGRYKDDSSARATLKVTFKSCIAKGLRGAGNMIIILDELAHFNNEKGQSDAETIYDAITPSTATFSPYNPKTGRSSGDSDGRVISISSPLGKQGFFYENFMKGFSGGLESRDMLCIQAPSWEVNPRLQATYFAKKYAKNPSSFSTEFGADFTSRTRGWIEREEDLVVCINPNMRPKVQGPSRVPHYMGVDVALKGDATAIAIGHHEGGKIITDLVAQIKAGEGEYQDVDRLEFDDVAEWVFQFTSRFYIAGGMFDQWAGIPFEQALIKRGLTQFKSVHMTKNLNSQIYQNAKSMLWDKKVVLYDFPIEEGHAHSSFIQELLELQATHVSKHVVLVAAPKIANKHDDRSDAWVRMVWQVSKEMKEGKYLSRGSPKQSAKSVHAEMARRRRNLYLRSRQMGSNPDRQVTKNGRLPIGRRRRP